MFLFPKRSPKFRGDTEVSGVISSPYYHIFKIYKNDCLKLKSYTGSAKLKHSEHYHS